MPLAAVVLPVLSLVVCKLFRTFLSRPAANTATPIRSSVTTLTPTVPVVVLTVFPTCTASQLLPPPPAPSPQPPMHFPAAPQAPYGGAGPHQPAPFVGGPQQPTPGRGPPTAPAPVGAAMPGQPLTQQIYIPNDMVGAIIGKGGAKINEIRHLSGSVIKINEPQESSNERLVTITGTAECNQMALYMLYSRLGSSSPSPGESPCA